MIVRLQPSLGCGDMKPNLAPARPSSKSAALAASSPYRVVGAKTTRGGADGSSASADATMGPLLQWVNLTKECKNADSIEHFTPRCAHAMTVMPSSIPGLAASFPTTVALMGGCNEAEYSPAEKVGSLYFIFLVVIVIYEAAVRVCACVL